MRMSFVLLPLIIVQNASAAFETLHPGARALGLGGITTVLPVSAWAAFGNPATLNATGQPSLAFSYTPQQYGLTELRSGSASFVQPTPLGAFALSGSTFGFSLYRETTFGLSYGRRFTDEFYVGATLSYFSLSIPSYGSGASLGISIGGYLSLTDEISWGFHIVNVNGPTIGIGKEKLPQNFATGIGFQPVPEVLLAAEISKDIRYPAEFLIGVEYTFIDLVSIRGGLATEPSLMNGGLGIHYRFFTFDYAVTSHVDLGSTHTFSVAITLGGF